LDEGSIIMPELPQPVSHTVTAIYDAIAAKAKGFGDSRGVPMGQSTNDCDRAIWYVLRWANPPEQIDGIKQSRFDTGFYWEDRLLSDLERAGCEVQRVDPATGKQFRVELADGWLRGKMDGQALGVPEATKTLHVVECKSHSEKSFKELIKHAPPKGEGLRKSKPDHFAQCQNYMHARGLSRCLYLAVNKNTDERYAERLEYDAAFCLALEAKIQRIVRSDRAPEKLHENPAAKSAFACGWCPALALCHEGAFARKNCRTCLSAELRDGAEVWCSVSGLQRSYDEQQKGCPSHLYLPSLVPAVEQIDADEAKRAVTYRMLDGSIWVDGGKNAG
jgi:hypothetical protein